MLAIKLKRIGKKKQAAFRIIVAEKREKMAGRYAEDLGYFNPHSNQFNINKEKTAHWIKVGAQPTDSVHNLLVKAGIIKGAKRPVHKTPLKSGAEQKIPETEQQITQQEPTSETPAVKENAQTTETAEAQL